MITVTENAGKELTAFFADKDKSPIRIFLGPGGCQGPRLALALDEATADDQVENTVGFDFVINKELLQSIGGVTIDASSMGFSVTPEIALASASGCSACPSGSSGCCG